MNIKSATFITLALLLLNGCKEPFLPKTQTVALTIKTPQIRFNAQGFVKHFDNRLVLQLYSMAQGLFEATFTKDQVCLQKEGCIGLDAFQKKFYGTTYDYAILFGLLKGLSLEQVQRSNEFTQQYEKDYMPPFVYRISKKSNLFIDTINHIKIKVTKR